MRTVIAISVTTVALHNSDYFYIVNWDLRISSTKMVIVIFDCGELADRYQGEQESNFQTI